MEQKKRILIADDEQEWRDRIAVALVDEVHELVFASGIYEAEALLWGDDAQPFDLVISDNNMHPHIPDCGLKIREGMLLTSQALEDTPFILYTSDDSPLLLAKLPRLKLIHRKKNYSNQDVLVGLVRDILRK